MTKRFDKIAWGYPKILTRGPWAPTTDRVRGLPYGPVHGLTLRTFSTDHTKIQLALSIVSEATIAANYPCLWGTILVLFLESQPSRPDWKWTNNKILPVNWAWPISQMGEKKIRAKKSQEGEETPTNCPWASEDELDPAVLLWKATDAEDLSHFSDIFGTFCKYCVALNFSREFNFADLQFCGY